jgi:hypothetical protein
LSCPFIGLQSEVPLNSSIINVAIMAITIAHGIEMKSIF